MTGEEIFTLITVFLGGFALFMYGMHLMGEGLQKAAGNKMKNLLGKLTNNRFLGVLIGAVVTAIVQSSSATTVMVVGIVNAGLITLTQAVGVIMGANIGTTITSWIVSMGDWLVFFKPSNIAPILIAFGVLLMMISKNKAKKQVGEIFVGLGILFVGLDFMSNAIKPYSESEVFITIFQTLGQNPILGVLAGAGVTALLQSSSASVSILIVLASSTFVPWDAAIYIILGQNIGTCITAGLSSIGANIAAKRAACVHFLFNTIGTIIAATFVFILFLLVPSLGDGRINPTQISIVHTIFNVSATIVLFPFAKQIVSLSTKIVRGKDKKVSAKENALRHLDDRILETPSFAVENAIKEVVYMGELAIDNTELALKALMDKENKLVNQVFENEKKINMLEKLITNYLVKISNAGLTNQQQIIITNLFHSVNDIERIGDHAKNIAELADVYMENELQFSDVAREELAEISKIALKSAKYSIKSRAEESNDLVRKVVQNEELVDSLEEELREKHIRRLSNNQCDSTTGVVFLDIISNLERISDHAVNIAYAVKDELM